MESNYEAITYITNIYGVLSKIVIGSLSLVIASKLFVKNYFPEDSAKINKITKNSTIFVLILAGLEGLILIVRGYFKF